MEKDRRKHRGHTRVVLKKPTKEYVCIVCPNCCELETDGRNVVGAGCKKGKAFALQEWVDPRRVVTTTIRSEDGARIVAVKTACPVPLSSLSTIMARIKSLRLSQVPPIGTRIAVPGLSESLEIIVTAE